jgi:predicted Fe-Mo cluster-binding NifX family protein
MLESTGITIANSDDMRPVQRRLAVSIWEGRVSPVFDVCREVIIVDTQDGALHEQRSLVFSTADPVGKIGRLTALGVDTLICGAISARVKFIAEMENIRVLAFIAGEMVDVLNAYVKDGLRGYAMRMPGCRHRRRCRRRASLMIFNTTKSTTEKD